MKLQARVKGAAAAGDGGLEAGEAERRELDGVGVRRDEGHGATSTFIASGTTVANTSAAWTIIASASCGVFAVV